LDGVDRTHQWNGAGRWLSFAAAALLLAFSIPMIFSTENGAAAGWNIFLGLLLFGGVASGSAAAPKITAVIAALMLVRLALLPLFGAHLMDFLLAVLFFALVAYAAFDLRRQARSS
jgi:hypothetical protein